MENSDKNKLVSAIREEVKKVKLPKELKYEDCSIITDLPKFIESHLCVIEAQNGKIKDIFGRRLAIVLYEVGINVFEIKKRINERKK